MISHTNKFLSEPREVGVLVGVDLVENVLNVDGVLVVTDLNDTLVNIFIH